MSRIALAVSGCLAICLAICLAMVATAQADTWSDLWLTREQQAQRLLDANQPAAAAAVSKDPRRQAYAHLRARQYDKAAELLAPFKDADSQYNRGNALAHAGQLREALKAYDTALAASPGNRDVIRNRDLVKRALEQQNQQQQSGNGNSRDGRLGSGQGDSKGARGNQGGQPDRNGGRPDSSASGSQSQQSQSANASGDPRGGQSSQGGSSQRPDSAQGGNRAQAGNQSQPANSSQANNQAQPNQGEQRNPAQGSNPQSGASQGAGQPQSSNPSQSGAQSQGRQAQNSAANGSQSGSGGQPQGSSQPRDGGQSAGTSQSSSPGQSPGASQPQSAGSPGGSPPGATGASQPNAQPGSPSTDGKSNASVAQAQTGVDQSGNLGQGNAQSTGQPSALDANTARNDAAAALRYQQNQQARGAQAQSATGPNQLGALGSRADVGRQADAAPGQPPTEQSLALDQWLRGIPEDSGELLQRKFLIEHMMRQQGDPQ